MPHAVQTYTDIEAITAKVKEEFAAKEKAKESAENHLKPQRNAAKKTAT